MSTKVRTTTESSTSTRGVRRSGVETAKIQPMRASSTTESGAPEVVDTTRFRSEEERLYQSEGFRLAWDNDISFHVAEHAVRLRRRRGLSQADVAEVMGTSQPAVARMESGDENITLKTLKRLVAALDGRIQFSIQPKELSLPTLPNWWEWEEVASGVVTASPWGLLGAVTTLRGATHLLGAAWAAHTTERGTDIFDKALAG